MKRIALHFVTLWIFILALAFILPQRAVADDDDPPSRVARLAYARGNVSFEPAGTDDWVTAVVNRPLTTGDKLWNDADGVSELHLGTAFIRIGNNTGFSFLNLSDNMTQIRLTEGTLNIRVRRLADDESFEVDTPNLAFNLLRSGNYKINVNEAGDTTLIIVREGQGEVTGGGSAYTIHPREVATFVGGDQLDADVQPWDNATDDFDNWCDARDHRAEHSVSAQYVSDDVIGYEDLDEYGGWRPVPEYGTVWFPHVTIVGWAPYHYGHWVYIAPWGYTWVDDAPWGFAPFHYGRWVVVGGVWGWVPAPPRPVVVGAVYVRPVYAPALVAWVGGPHFGVGVAVGGGVGVNVGWFPLGPREVYVPSYRVSRTYVTNINVSNTRVETTVVNNYYNTVVVNKTTITNVTYVNQRVPGAVTACSHETFTTARPVARNIVAVNVREVSAAPVAVGAPAIAPRREAVLGAGAEVRMRPPAAFQSRTVVVKTAPPPPPVAFARQQQMIQANGGRPVAVSEMRQAQPQSEMVRAGVKVAPAATPREIEVRRGGQFNNPNRAGTPNNGMNARGGNNPPNNVNNANNAGNPNNINNANNPSNANRQGNPPVTNTNVRTYNDRPPSNRPSNISNPSTGNPQIEQQHQQQLQNLRNQQDVERQRLEQKQQQDNLRLAQKNANDKAQEQANQQHQRQLENLEQKHDNQQNKLEQKQIQQDRRVQQAPPPKQQGGNKKEEKEKDKKPNK